MLTYEPLLQEDNVESLILTWPFTPSFCNKRCNIESAYKKEILDHVSTHKHIVWNIKIIIFQPVWEMVLPLDKASSLLIRRCMAKILLIRSKTQHSQSIIHYTHEWSVPGKERLKMSFMYFFSTMSYYMYLPLVHKGGFSFEQTWITFTQEIFWHIYL